MQAIIVLTVVIVNEAAVRRTNIKTAERAQPNSKREWSMSTTSISTPPTSISLSPRMRLLHRAALVGDVGDPTMDWVRQPHLVGNHRSALRLTVPIMLAGLAGSGLSV